MAPKRASKTSTKNWDLRFMKPIPVEYLDMAQFLKLIQKTYYELPVDHEFVKAKALIFQLTNYKQPNLNHIFEKKIGIYSLQKHFLKNGVLCAIEPSECTVDYPNTSTLQEFISKLEERPSVEPSVSTLNDLYTEIIGGSIFPYKLDIDLIDCQQLDITKFSSPLSLIKENLAGIKTSFGQMGGVGSIARLHNEDQGLGSINVQYYGKSKFWIFIHEQSGDLLVDRMKQALKIKNKDDCFIRSKHYHPTPSTLTDWGVKFSMANQSEGMIVVTLPGTLHEIVNLSTNFNASVNFIPTDLRMCQPIKSFKPCSCFWSDEDREDYEKEQPPTLDPSTYRKHGQDFSHYIGDVYELIIMWLNMDMNSHTKKDLKRFQCKTCHHISKDKSNLNQHMETHDSKRLKLVCTMCNAQIFRKSDMKRHIRNVHGEIGR